MKKITLISLITVLQLCLIYSNIFAQDQGNIYLIGQIHYDSTSHNPQQYPYLAEVQTDIYFTLKELIEANNLSLLIAEGLGPNKFDETIVEKKIRIHKKIASRIDNSNNFILKYFKKHPYVNVASLIGLDYSHKIDIYGANDIKESQEYKSLCQQLSFDEKKMKKCLQKKVELTDRRSEIYLKEAISKADKLKHKNVAILIGALHLPHIIKNYKGKRKLHIIIPQTLYTKSGLKKHHFDLFDRVQKLYINNHKKESLNLLNQFILEIKENFPGHFFLYNMYCLRAQIWLSEQKWKKAINDIEKAVQICPDDLQLQFVLYDLKQQFTY